MTADDHLRFEVQFKDDERAKPVAQINALQVFRGQHRRQSAVPQDQAPTVPTADQLVSALGETAEQQAAALHAGLDTDGLVAVIEALHARL